MDNLDDNSPRLLIKVTCDEYLSLVSMWSSATAPITYIYSYVDIFDGGYDVIFM